jgi:hypothetical protein
LQDAAPTPFDGSTSIISMRLDQRAGVHFVPTLNSALALEELESCNLTCHHGNFSFAHTVPLSMY